MKRLSLFDMHTIENWMAGSVSLLVSLALWYWSSSEQILPNAKGDSWMIAIGNIIIVIVVSLIITVVIKFVAKLAKRKIPFISGWLYIASFGILLSLKPGISPSKWLLVSLAIPVTVFSLYLLSRQLIDDKRRKIRAMVVSLSALVVCCVIYTIAFVPLTGYTSEFAFSINQGQATQPSASSPGKQNYQVAKGSYGSHDYQRAHNASDKRLTRSVDGSKIIRGWNDSRQKAWGFGPKDLPLNALTWEPQRDKAPIVLIVHGNKSNTIGSETGFQYLGESLARQGYFVASIDENFLNTSLLDSNGGIGNATNARAWLALEHVRQLLDWNQDMASSLYDKLDASNISLIGHSRGGEAVAIAQYFLENKKDSTSPGITFDYNFKLKNIIALAPSDGQYQPDQKNITLHGVNYLTLMGSQDSDVITFQGKKQYERVQPGPDGIKMATLFTGGNHSNFNSIWGTYDVGYGLAKYFINGRLIMPHNEQQVITQTYVTSFLNYATFGDNATLNKLTTERAAREGLPATRYEVTYQKY